MYFSLKKRRKEKKVAFEVGVGWGLGVDGRFGFIQEFYFRILKLFPK